MSRGDHPSVVQQGAAARQLLGLQESRLDDSSLQQRERLGAYLQARYMKYVFESASRLAGFREDLIDYFPPLALRARRIEQIVGLVPDE